MCFGGDSTTHTQNESATNQSSSYDPWVTTAGKGLFDNAAGYVNSNPWQGYSGPTTAAFGPQTQQASGYLSQQLGQTNPYTTQAGGIVGSVAGAIDPNASIASYMSPNIAATLQPTLDNINQAAGQQDQQNNANASLAGSYGGTASGVMKALLDKSTQANIGGATANAYNNAWNSAQTARMGNLQTLLSAGSGLSGIGQQAFGQGTTLASLLAGLGGQQQQAGQQGIQNAISLNTQNQTMPMQQQQTLASILASLPKNSTTTGSSVSYGQSMKPDNSGFSMLASLL